LETKTNMMEDISKGFHVWSSNQPLPQMLTDAGQLQSFILWDNFSHRFLAVSWQMQQQNYYNNQQLRCSSTKWASEVLKWVLKSAQKTMGSLQKGITPATTKLSKRPQGQCKHLGTTTKLVATGY